MQAHQQLQSPYSAAAASDSAMSALEDEDKQLFRRPLLSHPPPLIPPPLLPVDSSQSSSSASSPRSSILVCGRNSGRAGLLVTVLVSVLLLCALLALLFTLSRLSLLPFSFSSSSSSSPWSLPARPILGVSDRDSARVAICMAVKDSTDDLVEWVRWHHDLAGVERMYIFDNMDSSQNSTHARQLLHPWIESGVVEYLPYQWDTSGHIYLKQRYPYQQKFAYTTCTNLYGWRHEWMMSMDSDEFIEYAEMSNGTTLQQMMETYEDDSKIGGVHLSWRVFANHQQHHLHRPQHGGVVLNYVSCFPRNGTTHVLLHHGKTLNRPRATHDVDVHVPYLLPGWRLVDEHKRTIPQRQPSTYHTSDRLWVNHYISRSVDENEVKLKRKGGDGNSRSNDFFLHADGNATDLCPTARQLLLDHHITLE